VVSVSCGGVSKIQIDEVVSLQPKEEVEVREVSGSVVDGEVKCDPGELEVKIPTLFRTERERRVGHLSTSSDT
jgi:hypothetical protein